VSSNLHQVAELVRDPQAEVSVGGGKQPVGERAVELALTADLAQDAAPIAPEMDGPVPAAPRDLAHGDNEVDAPERLEPLVQV